jgi:hypothetical protein
VTLSHNHHAGDKGEREYTFYSFLTSALGGCAWSVSCPGRALPSGKNHWYPSDRRLGGPQCWSGQRLKEESFASARDQTLVSRLSHLWTDSILTELS